MRPVCQKCGSARFRVRKGSGLAKCRECGHRWKVPVVVAGKVEP